MASVTYGATGINFSDYQTPNAGQASELLDHYEEGTFTGTFTGSSGAPSSPQTQTGYYTTVGTICQFNVYFSNINTSGSSGTIYITGIPFTSRTSQRATAPLAVYNVTFTAGAAFFSLAGNSTTIEILQSRSGTTWTQPDTSTGAGRYLLVAMTYLTNPT